MTFKGRLNYIKSRLNNKRNYLFGAILVLIILIFLICLTAIVFTLTSVNNIKERNISYRTLYVSKDGNDDLDFEKINDIEHVVYNISNKYIGIPFSSNSFATDNVETLIQVLPLINMSDITIIKGRTIEGSNEMIIPNKFYPYKLHDNNQKIGIDKSLYINGNDLIGKTITFYNNEKVLQAKIAGTFDPVEINVASNESFISVSDYDLYANNYGMCFRYVYEDGTVEEGCEGFNDRFVRVDKLENVDSVINKIRNLGFFATVQSEFDQATIDLITSIPLLICIITTLIALNLLFSYIKKKISNRYSNYGILKAIGYSKKEIRKNEVLENTIIITISYISNLILYFIVFIIVSNYFMSEYTYENIYLHVPILYIIIVYLLLIAVSAIYTNLVLKRKLNLTIQDLLKKD